MGAPPKKLKFVEAFDEVSGRRDAQAQSGYEKVDDNRVLERYFHPVLWQKFQPEATTLMVTTTLYDFKSFTATVTTMTLDKNMSLQGAMDSKMIPFSAFENKMALRDAHRALKELGGDPPALEDMASVLMTPGKNPLETPTRASFKPK